MEFDYELRWCDSIAWSENYFALQVPNEERNNILGECCSKQTTNKAEKGLNHDNDEHETNLSDSWRSNCSDNGPHRSHFQVLRAWRKSLRCPNSTFHSDEPTRNYYWYVSSSNKSRCSLKHLFYNSRRQVWWVDDCAVVYDVCLRGSIQI